MNMPIKQPGPYVSCSTCNLASFGSMLSVQQHHHSGCCARYASMGRGLTMASSSRYFSRLDLACEMPAILLARLHVDDVLGTWGLSKDVVYDARTIVAELTTNAVRHVGDKVRPFDPEGGQPCVTVCTLCLWVSNGRLCISLHDASPELPQLRPVSETSENGRGLQMVAGLSEGSWGYQQTGFRPGKVVWAWLRLPSRPMEPKHVPAETDADHLMHQSA